MSSVVTDTPRDVRFRFPPMLVVIVLCLGSLCGALMQSLVIPIQSELPRLLGTAPGNASWAVTATLLASAVAMPVTGRLADIYGKKNIMVVSAGILAVGSLIAALSSSLAPFLAGRALQGVAMGYIPVAISMVREIAPPERRASAVAAVSATLGVGGALGLPLSAWIADGYSWHALFWLSTALAAVILVLTLIVVPSVRDQHPAHIDILGTIGLAVGLCATLIGVSKGSEWGWSDRSTIGSIAGGVIVLLLWVWYELRHHDPLVDLRTTARRPVLFTNLAAVLIGFGMMAQAIVVPQLLQMPEATGYGLGQTILQAGLWMAPGGLMMMLFAPVSSKLINTAGARITLAVGAVVISGGYLIALGGGTRPGSSCSRRSSLRRAWESATRPCRPSFWTMFPRARPVRASASTDSCARWAQPWPAPSWPPSSPAARSTSAAWRSLTRAPSTCASWSERPPHSPEPSSPCWSPVSDAPSRRPDPEPDPWEILPRLSCQQPVGPTHRR